MDWDGARVEGFGRGYRDACRGADGDRARAVEVPQRLDLPRERACVRESERERVCVCV